MKHLTGAVLVAAVLASLTFAAMGAASTSGKGAAKSTAAAAKLPALPSYVKSRHKWVIGVKCDFPPFGYYRLHGQHAATTSRSRGASRQLAFGSQVQGQARLRDDAEPHPGAAVVAGRHHHLDADVDAGA